MARAFHLLVGGLRACQMQWGEVLCSRINAKFPTCRDGSDGRETNPQMEARTCLNPPFQCAFGCSKEHSCVRARWEHPTEHVVMGHEGAKRTPARERRAAKMPQAAQPRTRNMMPHVLRGFLFSAFGFWPQPECARSPRGASPLCRVAYALMKHLREAWAMMMMGHVPGWPWRGVFWGVFRSRLR